MAMEESAYFSTDLAAITAAINIAFDVAAIATYLQGYYKLGAYEVNDPPPGFEIEQTSLFLMAVIVSLVLFGGGCLVRSVLAYRIRKGHSIPERLAAAVRAFVQLEVAYMAYQRLPGRVGADRQMLRMVKMVDLAIKMPSTCLAVIMYVMYSLARAVYQVDNYKGLGSTKDLDSLLIVTAVFGILTSSIAAAETLIDKPWSLWHHPDFGGVQSAGKKYFSILRWLATAVSVLAHVLVYMLLAPQLRGYTFAVIGGWWAFCAVVYFISCRQLWRSIRCGYLSALMNLPFNPAAAQTTESSAIKSKNASIIAVANQVAIPSHISTRSDSAAAASQGLHSPLDTAGPPPAAAAAGTAVTSSRSHSVNAAATLQYPVIDDSIPHLAVPSAMQPAATPVAPAAAAAAAPAPAPAPALATTAAQLHPRSWWSSALLTLLFCTAGMAIAAMQIRSCYFTTYRCISTNVGLGIQANCSLLYNMTLQQQQTPVVRSPNPAPLQHLGSGYRLLQLPDASVMTVITSDSHSRISDGLDSKQASSDHSRSAPETQSLLPAAAIAGGSSTSPSVPDSITGPAQDDSSDVYYHVDYPYDGSDTDAAAPPSSSSSSSGNALPPEDALSDGGSNFPSPTPGHSNADTNQHTGCVAGSNATSFANFVKVSQGIRRSVTGTCRRNDTRLEARIGYVAAVFVGLDALLFCTMCVLAALGLA